MNSTVITNKQTPVPGGLFLTMDKSGGKKGTIGAVQLPIDGVKGALFTTRFSSDGGGSQKSIKIPKSLQSKGPGEVTKLIQNSSSEEPYKDVTEGWLIIDYPSHHSPTVIEQVVESAQNSHRGTQKSDSTTSKESEKENDEDVLKIRDFENIKHKDRALLYYRTTDAKEKVADVIKSQVIPNLAKKHNLRMLVIGSGEGSFSQKIAGRASIRDYFPQKISEMELIEKSKTAKRQSELFLAQKFKKLRGRSKDTRKIEVTDIVEKGTRTPMKYSIKLAIFPNISPKTKKADLVILNHMLHYNETGEDYQNWVDLSKEAFKYVSPGGAMVILLHEFNYSPAGSDVPSLGSFIRQIGGETEDINRFTDKVSGILLSEGAEKVHKYFVETRNLLTDETCAYDIVKFFITGSNPNLAALSEGTIMKFLRKQKLLLRPNERGFPIAKGDKLVVITKGLEKN